MPPVQLARSAYDRRSASTPELTLVNLMMEADPTSSGGTVLIQRPGLVPFAAVGDDRIRGIVPDGGVLDSSSYFVVGGSVLAKVDKLGAVTTIFTGVTGNSFATIATSTNRAVIAHGGPAVSTDGATGVLITAPDPVFPNFGSSAFLAGFFLLASANSQRIYFMTNGATAPDALDYFSAEQKADNLLLIITVGNELWAFGRQIVEVFTPTGDADAPFTPQPGRAMECGCISRLAVAVIDTAPSWVGADLVVYRAAGNGPTRISTHGIEERLRRAYDDNQSLAINLWAYTLDGHAVLVLTCGQHGTFTFDFATQKWAEARTNGSYRWRVWQGAQNGSQIIAGDVQTNQLYRLDTSVNTDSGTPFYREVTGLYEVGNPEPCSSLYLKVNPGETAAPGADLQVSWSDNQGRTFSDPVSVPLGEPGDYDREVIIRRLGQMRQPGRVFKFACSDDARLRISSASVNDTASQ
jgi:hypothetical protein